jgi:hypothetical protein
MFLPQFIDKRGRGEVKVKAVPTWMIDSFIKLGIIEALS